MDDPIRWDDDPSFPSQLPVQVHSPRPGTSSFLRLLGPHVGAFVHTVREGRRKSPRACLRTNCPFCKKDEAIWKAYFPALLWRRQFQPQWMHVVGEVTTGAFEDLRKDYEPQHCRGRVIEVSRGQTNSRMHAKWLERPAEGLGDLPAAFDVKIVLRRLWNQSKPVSRDNAAFDPVPPPALEPVNLPSPIARLDEPPIDRSKLPKLLDAFKHRNGGAK